LVDVHVLLQKRHHAVVQDYESTRTELRALLES